MPLDHKFGSDCDQNSPRLRWRAHGVMAPAFVLVGLVIMGTTAIAARATIVSIAPATAAVYAGVGLPVNLRGLSIAKVHVTVAQQTEGPGELLITGEIENLRDAQDVCAGSALGASWRGWARDLCLDGEGTEDQPQRS